mgnify:CR=1 FL=1
MDDAERAHWNDVLHAYEDYPAWMALEVARRHRGVAAIPPHLASLLCVCARGSNARMLVIHTPHPLPHPVTTHPCRPPGSLEAREERLVRAAGANASLLRAIAAAQRDSGFGGEPSTGAAAAGESSAAAARPTSSAEHFSKVRSTLAQLARDWGGEGGAERDTSYGPVMAALRAALPVTAANSNRQRVAVPGCGLGRLVWELARAGYAAQGCEFSYFMLFASHYILNCTDRVATAVIHPWIHDACNHMRGEDMLRGVAVPDVYPARDLLEANPGADLSMAAGDFVAIYSTPAQAGAWDAVATCFFLDTAPCVLEYIDVIWHMLRPGGVWVNNGPLLYHWASPAAAADVSEADALDERYLRSLELPYADVRYAMIARGFRVSDETSARTTYAANKLSLQKTVFTTVIFTATKPADADGGGSGGGGSGGGGGGAAGSGRGGKGARGKRR